jgi:hypothetical protein
MRTTHLWILVIVGLSAGAGVLLVRHQNQNDIATAWARTVALDQQLQDDAFQGFRSGRRDLALPALEAYLQYLELGEPLRSPWQPGQNPWLDATGLATERMLTAGRLAIVLEGMDATDRAASLWNSAVEYARLSGRSGVSLAAVREAVERSGPIAGPPDPDVH